MRFRETIVATIREPQKLQGDFYPPARGCTNFRTRSCTLRTPLAIHPPPLCRRLELTLSDNMALGATGARAYGTSGFTLSSQRRPALNSVSKVCATSVLRKNWWKPCTQPGYLCRQ